MSLRSMVTEMVQRATVIRVIDSGKRQIVQVQGETEDDIVDIEMMLPYGFSCSPPPGSEYVSLEEGDGVAITAQHVDYRPKDLQPGEVILHYLGDTKLFLKNDGTVNVGDRAPTDAAALASKVDDLIDMVNDLRAAYLAHTHTTVTGLGTPTPPVSPSVPPAPAAMTGSSASQRLKIDS